MTESGVESNEELSRTRGRDVAAAAQQASAQHYDVDLESANAKLNQTYGFLMAHLAPSDQTGLRKSQRLWIAFRDADCAFGFRKLDDKQQCLVARTQMREEQIRCSYYLDAKNREIAIPTGPKAVCLIVVTRDKS